MMNRLKVRKEVSHGGVIPRGWQMAWYEPRRRIGVYYPAPLHWLLRGIREVVHRVRAAVRAPSDRTSGSVPDAARAPRAGAAGGRVRARLHGRVARMFSDVPLRRGRRNRARGRYMGRWIVSARGAKTSWHGKLTTELRARTATWLSRNAIPPAAVSGKGTGKSNYRSTDNRRAEEK